MTYPIPAVGQQFHDWTVVDATPITKSVKHGKYIKVACKCGYTKLVRVSTLYRGESKQCLACRGQQSSEKYFRGIGRVSQTYFYHVQAGAAARNIPFDVTIQDVWDIFEKQQGKCALSGLDLVFYKNHKNKGEQTASLDRIDSSRGYTKDNLQWIHKDINYMKSDLPQDAFVALCELVSKKKTAEPRIRVVARTQVEGIHRWASCPIEEVSFLRNYHRHMFHIEAYAYVTHSDRDVEFIQLAHEIKAYLTEKYYSDQYRCLFFDDSSCEMIADELVQKFDLYECRVNEDGEGGSVVRKY